jgi:hypothetical protein
MAGNVNTLEHPISLGETPSGTEWPFGILAIPVFTLRITPLALTPSCPAPAHYNGRGATARSARSTPAYDLYGTYIW